MTIESHAHDALEPFFVEGLIVDIQYEVKSGKEATVYCCTAGASLGGGLVAAKVYRPLESRSFRDDSTYLAGRLHLARSGRVQRAAANKTSFGREVQYGTWLYQEWETMRRLHAAGVDTLEPISLAERAILMPFVGDAEGAAPLLHHVEADVDLAERLVERLLENIALMLHAHCVHGDLSPYNVLVQDERATIIDFPQAVDPRANPSARRLLERDIENICGWGRRRGVDFASRAIARDLWRGFRLGEIG